MHAVAERLGQLAEALARRADDLDKKAQALAAQRDRLAAQAGKFQELAGSASDLQRRQAELAKGAEQLGAALQARNAKTPSEKWLQNRLAAAQAQLAERIADLAQRATPAEAAAPDEAQRRAEAAGMAARRAASVLQAAVGAGESKPLLSEALQQQSQAEKALKSLASALLDREASQQSPPNGTADQPDFERIAEQRWRSARLAQQAQRLASEQACLARQSRALQVGKPAAALAQMQQRLLATTRDSGEAVRLLADGLAEISSPPEKAGQLAKQGRQVATSLARDAVRRQATALRRLSSRAAGKAADSMRQAAEVMSKAQAALGELQKQIATAAASGQIAGSAEAASDETITEALQRQLEALRAMQSARTDRGGAEAALARAGADLAALRLYSAAEAFMRSALEVAGVDQAADAVFFGWGTGGTGSLRVRLPDRRSLDDLPAGILGREWFRLKGLRELQTISNSFEHVPAEYRELVKRYSQHVAKLGRAGAVPGRAERKADTAGKD